MSGEVEALRSAGLQVDVSMDALHIQVPKPRFAPWMKFCGILLLPVLLGGTYMAHMEQSLLLMIFPASVLLSAAAMALLYWGPSWITTPNIGEITLTDSQLCLRKRSIDLNEVQSVTFIEGVQSGIHLASGVQVTLEAETIITPMPIAVEARAPLVRLIRQHIERRRHALRSANLTEPVPPPPLQALRDC